MSPARRRRQFVPARPRSEVVVAAIVGAAIVLGTVLLIWLLRPGTAGVAGGGGLLSRQPRISLLVVVAALALGGVVWYVLRRARNPRFGTRGSIAIGSAAVVVLAVVGGIFWPGGVIRHFPSLPNVNDVPPSQSSVPSSGPPATTATPGKTGSTVTTQPTTPTTSPATSSTPTTKGG